MKAHIVAKNKNPIISIIVPVYNNEKYIGKCLESILAQTYQNFEAWVIDDGSKDNTPEILDVFEKQDPRIKVIHQEKKGVSSARNEGLKKATGEYIMFVDGDDYIEPKALEDSYKYITEHNADVCMFNYQKVFYQDNEKHIQLSPYTLSFDGYFEDAPREFFERIPAIWGKLFRNDALLPRFDENLKKGEDALLWWEYCAKNPKIYATNKVYYNYVKHQDSVVKQKELVFECDNIHSAQKLLGLSIFRQVRKEAQAHIFERYAFNILLEIDLVCGEDKRWPKFYRKAIGKFLADTYSREISTLKSYSKLRSLCLKQYFPLISMIYKTKFENGIKTTKIFGIPFKRIISHKEIEKKYIEKLKENQEKYKHDTYLLMDCTYSVAECSDAYSLFLYMKQEGLNVYYVLLKQNPLYEKLVREDKLDRIIVLPKDTRKISFCAFLYSILLKTKAIISSYDLEFSYPDFWVNNPYFKYIYIQHGQSYLKESIFLNGYLDHRKYNYAVIPSDSERKVFKKYGWGDEQLIKTPLPRWDLLPQKNAKNKKILVMFTWRRRKEEVDTSLYKDRFLSLLKNKALKKYLKSQKIELYFAFHHEFLSDPDIDRQIVGKNIVPSDKISEYIKECSLLITDFSSVAFDFMFQNKPVLFYLLDHDDPFLGKSDKLDIKKMEYKKYFIENVFYSWDRTFEKLQYYIDHNFELEKKIEEKYNKFFYFKKDIRKRLTEEIKEKCNL